jgi:hypothetical protein
MSDPWFLPVNVEIVVQFGANACCPWTIFSGMSTVGHCPTFLASLTCASAIRHSSFARCVLPKDDSRWVECVRQRPRTRTPKAVSSANECTARALRVEFIGVRARDPGAWRPLPALYGAYDALVSVDGANEAGLHVANAT